jgi:hypothetical protein
MNATYEHYFEKTKEKYANTHSGYIATVTAKQTS